MITTYNDNDGSYNASIYDESKFLCIWPRLQPLLQGDAGAELGFQNGSQLLSSRDAMLPTKEGKGPIL